MTDLILAVLVVVLPTVFAIAVELVSEEIKGHPYWRASVLVFGLGTSALTGYQMWRANRLALRDREDAILETSERVSAKVSESVSKSVTKSVSEQYRETITDLQSQIGILQAQLAAEGKKVDVIRGSNIVTGRSPVRVEVVNPPASQGTLPPTADISWTQDQTSLGDFHGRPQTQVTLRVDNPVMIPAFIATCDRACETVGANVVGASQANYLTGGPNIAGVVFVLPRPLPPGQDVRWQIASKDSNPVRIVKIRLLSPSELPEDQK